MLCLNQESAIGWRTGKADISVLLYLSFKLASKIRQMTSEFRCPMSERRLNRTRSGLIKGLDYKTSSWRSDSMSEVSTWRTKVE